MTFDFKETLAKLDEVKNYLKQEYLQISTGRANPSLLDGVFVDSYGTKQPIKNIASINTEDARSMKISPWDKGQIKLIEKAIHDSGLPFSVSVDDSGVRVTIPQLTEESKKSLVKLIGEKLEDARVKVRNVRQDVMKDIEAMETGDDDIKRAKEDLQEHINKANKSLEEVFDTKEADIMKV